MLCEIVRPCALRSLGASGPVLCVARHTQTFGSHVFLKENYTPRQQRLTATNTCGIIPSEWSDSEDVRRLLPERTTFCGTFSTATPFSPDYFAKRNCFPLLCSIKCTVPCPPVRARRARRTTQHPLDKARPLWHISPCCCNSSAAKTAEIPQGPQPTRRCSQAAGRS